MMSNPYTKVKSCNNIGRMFSKCATIGDFFFIVDLRSRSRFINTLDWTNTGISYIFLTVKVLRTCKSTIKELHIYSFTALLLQKCFGKYYCHCYSVFLSSLIIVFFDHSG